MIKCCVFDLDGTLLNTLDSIVYYVNKTMRKYGISPIDVENIKYFVGTGSRELIRKCLKYRGELRSKEFFEEVHEAYKSLYDKAPLYLTEPYFNIVDVILSLRASGVRLAVLSNKPNTAVLPIARHFFGDVFEIVRGAETGKPLKPDPTGLLDMLEKMGLTPDAVAYFGDTKTDIETGKRAGVKATVGVLWGFRDEKELLSAGADIVISRPDEIREVIKCGE